jgi:chloramphenicol-sensitive protein RarD
MSSDSAESSSTRGAIAGTAAFLLWGIVPLYWKQMASVPAFELIAHRILWSLLFLLGVLAWRKSFASLRAAVTDRRIFSSGLLSGVLLALNWTIYVWAVNAGYIIETSLGYFLTPLCNVALGYVFLHERLRVLQWAAVALATGGVALLLFHTGRVPWIALSLASSWSLYGLLKKRSPLGPIPGLAVETLALFPVATVFLLWRAHTGEGALGHVNLPLHTLIVASGVITTIPLLLFAYAAQRLRLVTLGVVQYIAPSIQFLIGLLIYHEPFDSARLQACVLIWLALLLYTAHSFWAQRNKLWPVVETP